MSYVIKLGYYLRRSRTAKLVEQAPAKYRRVVVVLAYQLYQLALGGRRKLFVVGSLFHEWYLGPHEHPFAVAQVVEVLGMGIVGKAYAIGSYFLDEFHILAMVGL